MHFLLSKGSLYKVYNNNLLYHGCVPLNEDGTLKEVTLFGKKFKGKSLYDALERYVRKGFFAVDKEDWENGKDIMWYIWLNPNSPLFGKDKMATFERYFLAEQETHKEVKNPYYQYIENEKVIASIMKEFGLDFESDDTHIINGHVPVKRKNGESGRLSPGEGKRRLGGKRRFPPGGEMAVRGLQVQRAFIRSG